MLRSRLLDFIVVVMILCSPGSASRIITAEMQARWLMAVEEGNRLGDQARYSDAE
jgi:hypothetical protein